HWAWLLVKPGEVPITAEPLIYTRSAHQLDKAGFQYEALMALRSGARVWPQASIALMALGNAEYLAGNIESANAAFIQEIKQRRDNAAAWNNLAYGLSASQCHHQALAAISCALQQQPDNENYRRSAREIENLASKPLNTRSPQSTVLHQCAIPACPPVDQDN
ncbi:MAG: bacteriocin-processing peptidase family protein, partial [Gammaproteobacteria bacterium]|nr:bacteriocin-processing peptidase family protein [Gammaproteobacteria bacterium]